MTRVFLGGPGMHPSAGGCPCRDTAPAPAPLDAAVGHWHGKGIFNRISCCAARFGA